MKDLVAEIKINTINKYNIPNFLMCLYFISLLIVVVMMTKKTIGHILLKIEDPAISIGI